MRRTDRVIVLELAVHASFVLGRDPLGYANDYLHTGSRCLQYRCRCDLGWHRYKAGIGTRRRPRFSRASKHRNAFDLLATLCRVDAGDYLRAIVAVAKTVETCLSTSQAVDDQSRSVSSTKMLISRYLPAATALRAASIMLGEVITMSDSTVRSISRALLGICPIEADDHRDLYVHARQRGDDPVSDVFPTRYPTKNVDENGADARVRVDDFQGVGHDLRARTAAYVQEIGGASADLVDDIASAHCQAGAIGDYPDEAVEADILQAHLAGVPFPVIELCGELVLCPFGMAEGGVVVQGHLRVQGMHPPIGGEHERVHLDQVGVAFHETAVKVEQHVDRARPRLLVDGCLFDQIAKPGPR